MMDRYAFMADLVTIAANCIDNSVDRGCPYDVFVSNGEPSGDCAHIAMWWTGGSLLTSNKCNIVVRETFRVSLLMDCLKNTGDRFDPVKEDDDARCFVKDFGALFECLLCNAQDALKPYVRTCQDVMVKVASPDVEPRGGTMGGMIDISFTRVQPCC